MLNRSPMPRRGIRIAAVVAATTLAAISLTACQESSGGTGGASGKVGVALIVKTTTNPYFVAMEDAAKADASKDGVSLTLAAGKKDGDATTQIQAIEDSISRGDKGILITPTDSTVNTAIAKARKAGIYVIALDTAPDPAKAVDITYATDNFAAGEAIGKWAAAQLNGKPAVIGLVDLFSDQVASVDYDRDQGFLTGMGIPTADKQKNGDEAPTGSYTGGKGGTYKIAGNQASNGDQADGRTAMETLLSKNSDINVVYAINEPAAYGAYQALKAAGKEKTTLLVAIDGGCTGVKQVGQGIIGATSQQYPSKMAQLGMEAIVKLAKSGKKPSVSAGLDFFNTGSKLVTDKAVPGLNSISSADGAKSCWGN
ncbi:substrate-binding domain-containing protein [Lacisediminihabitans changchengi]|uniref:Substrate-binding domain-containing protein n=1 Tax=Lacisediminihabitans changchengi TaxID=2787634 RepID=A0A934VZD6_9MICO|nr:substrate-binding domain-containing protein [Lacisediminihabitans changchengi]MBK4349037.1 substrate-binding domain-containing protein [Lacisediminihabitans changchengi]